MMSQNYIAIILLSFLSAVSTLLGIFLAFFCKESKKKIALGIGFSVGIMLLISFFELIPESIKLSSVLNTFLALISGAFFIFILDYIFSHTHFIEEKGKLNWRIKAAYLVAIGIILHDFPEGFALANSYILAPTLGILVAISIALHNFPEEFVMAVPLVIAKNKKRLIQLGIISALAEPFGAVVGLIAVSVAPKFNPFFVAFAAGCMIFISVHELYPMAKRYRKPIYFIFGFIFSIFVYIGLNLFLK
ncbi:MAG: ZIP family metal transporter [Candidatus Pacebacteria bacterium]|nr:ZIP family metal transporter [Candidatus Paceibacterota bacterium]